MNPYFKDKLRLFAMKDNIIGQNSFENNGYLSRLDKFSSNLTRDDIWDSYYFYRNREYPKKGSKPLEGGSVIKDLLVNDNFTQNSLIREIYRKGQVDTASLRMVGHPNVKFISSMSRGVDRNILKAFLQLDDELFNRQYIRPLLI